MRRNILLFLSVISTQCLANGMQPETSVLLVNESKGEAGMNVINTDNYPSLLYTKIVDVAGSNKSVRLLVTQPVVRVEPGQTQRVRFMLQTDKPLLQEELKRVTFEGIPPKGQGGNELKVTIRQDLPVIIHPAGLAEDLMPWKQLTWRKKGDQLEVSNPSKYVVRMVASFTALPSGKGGVLKQTFLLPGASFTVKLPASNDTQIEFYPASRYGYKGERFVATIQ
ncbi:fimbria/pilus chaperone family protein [Enterobacteriaceae bacterium H4N4]|uniref:Fimbria/pilus chaperone family protein n=1 Tax=Silvania confinis TaxID=2926470 RepID=A0A9J6QD63_9ENTR|nr:fimbria/pilus chaperone family protein [Silvania confinis]MCU6669792.1 fimbria/pilus chaperone family protein [Silvania confinis]